MKTTKNLVIWGICIGLATFFIYKGINKHWLNPCKVYGPESTVPAEYTSLITSMCKSGFLKMIGLLQVVSGILLLIPRTRMIGAILLLPIIFNIFMIHAFLDNRLDELVESGIPLLGNIILIVLLYPKWKSIIGK